MIERKAYVFNYNPNNYNCTKAVNATMYDHNPQNGPNRILTANKAMQIKGMSNHILYPILCHLNNMQISKVSKFL